MQIILLILGSFCLLSLFFIQVNTLTRKKIYSGKDIPMSPTILVLGAGLERNGEPSDILKDRLITAHDLFIKASPQNLILSGAKNRANRSEVKAMQDFLLNYGMKRDKIYCDEEGFSTFHSLVNIKSANHPQPVTIITQRFHLSRALFVAKLLGLECYGFAANNLFFSKLKVTFWYFREIYALPFNILKFLNYSLASYLDNS